MLNDSAKERDSILPPTSQRKAFSPILESDDGDIVTSPPKAFDSPKISNLKKSVTTTVSKPSLKGSKVSFEQPDHDSDESFQHKRDHFQSKKSFSATDRKGILKDLRSFSTNDDRRAFQSKKHVSLDIKHSKILERILSGSSSEEEFTTNRKDFQSRKHQSLDTRVKFNLNKAQKAQEESSTDEESNEKGNLIQEKIHDFNKPIVIDFKDLDPSDIEEEDEDEEEDEEIVDEDFTSTRKSFQQQRTISVDSRKR